MSRAKFDFWVVIKGPNMCTMGNLEPGYVHFGMVEAFDAKEVYGFQPMHSQNLSHQTFEDI